MAWLQKRPQISDSIQLYSTSLNQTKLLVGLGNPGAEYNLTRHNVGFACLDNFVAKHDEMSDWVHKKDLKCLVSSGRLGDVQLYAIKPATFMNLSGEAVRAFTSFYKISLEYMVIIHDELDVNFGQIRLRNGGSSAGHNGLKSIIQHAGENFGRVRVGIGPKHPPQIDSADFVLQKFTSDEQAQLPNMYQEVSAILSEYTYGGQLPVDTRTFLI